MRRGRPHKSQIRQNIVEILYFLHEGYGYDLFKHYKSLFSPVTMRVIYYHLRTGKNLGEFKVNKISNERGDFSWGSNAEKIYYGLGEHAKPSGDARVKSYFENFAKSQVNSGFAKKDLENEGNL
ncbi:hypothetical protein HYU13_05575 [Candidatus Woesearchaeota archaeon]|nr:hypothetical protein [Candidatus Woesearchaeota archaeon]